MNLIDGKGDWKTNSNNIPEFVEKFHSWSFVFVCHIFVRRLNQTGNKWIHISDVSDWLLDNKFWMSLLLFAGELFNQPNSIFDTIISSPRINISFIWFAILSIQIFTVSLVTYRKIIITNWFKVPTKCVVVFINFRSPTKNVSSVFVVREVDVEIFLWKKCISDFKILAKYLGFDEPSKIKREIWN